MYDLYDEKTRERFTELDKGETADFKTLKNFKRLRKASRDFERLQEISKISSHF
jgi:hypothetical protein